MSPRWRHREIGAIAGRSGSGAGASGGFILPLAPDLDDDSLELLLFPSRTMASRLDLPMPVWAAMDVELRRPGVTRALLVEGRRARAPDALAMPGFASISTSGKAGCARLRTRGELSAQCA